LQLEKVDLVAICDPSDEALSSFSKDWQIENTFENAEQMLDEMDLDVVSICSPTEFHIDACKTIAKQNNIKGIFCEKPLAYTFNDSIEISKLLRDRFVSVNFFRRWNSTFVDLRADIQSKKYGEILAVHAAYTKGLFVNGSHLIDLLNWFFGTPCKVNTHKIYPTVGKDLGVDFSLSFSKGLTASVLHVPSVPYVNIDMSIFTEFGKIHITQRGQQIEWSSSVKDNDYNSVNKLKRVYKKDTQWRNCITRALSELLLIIDKKATSSCSLNEGLKVSEICEKIIKSH
jgi:predicted dehydrogenase